MYREVRQVVAHCGAVNVWPGVAGLRGEVIEEPAAPVHVAALGSIGVVPGPDAQPQLLQGGQGVGSALLVSDVGGRAPVPIRSVEEVDEVDSEGLLGLPYLPVLELA